MNRTVVVGSATPEQRRLLQVGQAMLEAGMTDLITIPFAGHGLGIGLHDHPYIMPQSDTILEKNMVFALEPGVYAAGIGGSRPEDMVLVTGNGCEILTHWLRDFDMLI